MSSIRDQIVAAVATLAHVTGTTVFRSRRAPIERAEGIVVFVEPAEETVDNRSVGQAIRDLVLDISVFIRSATPDSALDSTLVAIHAALMADPTLAGKCARIIEEGTTWTTEEADLTALEVSMRYRIRYATQTNALDRAL